MNDPTIFQEPSQRRQSHPRAITDVQHPLATSVLLHLLPGVAILLFVALIAPVAHRWGFPITFAGSLAILFVLVPLELGILLVVRQRHAGAGEREPVLRYTERSPWWQYVLFVPLLVLLYTNVSSWWNGLVVQLLQTFDWLPWWLTQPLPADDPTLYAPSALLLTQIVAVICSGLIAPIVEELYFRSYLLPRIDRLGIGAVAINAFLFGLHHLWMPLLVPGRFLAWFPIVYLVWRQRNIRLGLLVHLITNLIGVGLAVSTLSTV